MRSPGLVTMVQKYSCRNGPSAGFTLLEVLLAVALFAILAATALHSRAVMIRAEQQARRLDEARLLMRGIVALYRAGATEYELHDTIPEDWLLTATDVVSDITVVGATNTVAAWRLWRLDHRGGNATLETAVESYGGKNGSRHE